MTGGGGSLPNTLPVVLVPVGVDDDALDACLAALDASTPAETRVWLVDDAQAGPRGVQMVAPRSISACAKSPGRSPGTSGACAARISRFAIGNGVSISR